MATTVRRVYVDDSATIRFDLSRFSHPSRWGRFSSGDLDKWIETFWDEPISFFDHGRKTPLRYPRAFQRLAWKFVRVSGPIQEMRGDLVEILAPLLIVIVEADRSYLEALPKCIDAQGTLFSDVRRFKLRDLSEEMTVVLIAHGSGSYMRTGDPAFDPLRYALAIPAWLHTDLQVLRSLTKRVECNLGDKTYEHIVVPHLRRIASSLGNIIACSTEQKLTITAFEGLYGKAVPAIADDFDRLGFADLAHTIRSTFDPSRPKPRRSRSLTPQLSRGLNIFADWVRTGQLEHTRYDDWVFRKSAVQKAHEVARIIPPKGPYVIVSVGGADGTELFKLASLTGSSDGVLLEKAERSVEDAKREATRLNFNLIPVKGDATQGLAGAMECAKSLSAESGGRPILVTTMALLHELPTRSRDFDLLSFFGKLHGADVLVGREPTEPSLWSPRVLLKGNFQASKFVKFANDIILGHYVTTHRGSDNLALEEVGPKTVRGHRGIILETLVKAFYVCDLLYELNEWFTWFKKEDFEHALETCLDDTHEFQSWAVPSMSVMNYFQRYALEARDADSYILLGTPASHFWYVAIKKDFE